MLYLQGVAAIFALAAAVLVTVGSFKARPLRPDLSAEYGRLLSTVIQLLEALRAPAEHVVSTVQARGELPPYDTTWSASAWVQLQGLGEKLAKLHDGVRGEDLHLFEEHVAAAGAARVFLFGGCVAAILSALLQTLALLLAT